MWTKTIIAMLCITALEITAIFKDLDGVLLAGAVATIAGLGGFVIGKTKR